MAFYQDQSNESVKRGKKLCTCRIGSGIERDIYYETQLQKAIGKQIEANK